MSLKTIKNEYLDQIRKAKENEKLSFFIGAGFSTSKDPSKYGGWQSIITKLKCDLSKELQSENIRDILTAFLVLNFDKSKDVNELQPLKQ